jgi:hypothetical protein
LPLSSTRSLARRSSSEQCTHRGAFRGCQSCNLIPNQSPLPRESNRSDGIHHPFAPVTMRLVLRWPNGPRHGMLTQGSITGSTVSAFVLSTAPVCFAIPHSCYNGGAEAETQIRQPTLPLFTMDDGPSCGAEEHCVGNAAKFLHLHLIKEYNDFVGSRSSR